MFTIVTEKKKGTEVLFGLGGLPALLLNSTGVVSAVDSLLFTEVFNCSLFALADSLKVEGVFESLDTLEAVGVALESLETFEAVGVALAVGVVYSFLETVE